MPRKYRKFGVARESRYDTQIRGIAQHMKMHEMIMPEEEQYIINELEKENRYG